MYECCLEYGCRNAGCCAVQVFCTVQVEAWFDLFNDSDITTAGSEATGSEDGEALQQTFVESAKQWGNCRPVKMNASVWWSFGKLDNSQSHCPVETRVGIESGGKFDRDIKERDVSYMAPNYNCWEMPDERCVMLNQSTTVSWFQS